MNNNYLMSSLPKEFIIKIMNSSETDFINICNKIQDYSIKEHVLFLRARSNILANTELIEQFKSIVLKSHHNDQFMNQYHLFKLIDTEVYNESSRLRYQCDLTSYRKPTYYKVGKILGEEIIKEYDDTGNDGIIFKDEEAFLNSLDKPCYVPEYGEDIYTKQDFLDICEGNEELAKELFYSVNWQHPTTLFDEWVTNNEVDYCEEKKAYYNSYGLAYCPLCGKKREED